MESFLSPPVGESPLVPRKWSAPFRQATLLEQRVEPTEVLHVGKGDQVVAPAVPPLFLHASLLVGALPAGEAVEALEQVMTAQRHEALLFRALPWPQDLLDRHLGVVVPDPAGDAAERLEGAGGVFLRG